MESIDWRLLAPAFTAGLLVLLTHAPLGHEVLRRGIIFLDLSIAQIAALGALFSVSLGNEPGDLVTQVSSFAAAVAGAVFLGWCEERWPEVQEAIIGILFVLSATGALLLLAHNAHGSEELKDILAGQILWVSFEQLWTGGLIYVCLMPLLLSRLLERRVFFYIIFSLCVTLSVQWVGVYLVFSTLVIPALATRVLSGKKRILYAYGIGAVGYASGLIFSAWYDLPSGPLIAWTLAVTALVWRATYGLINRADPSSSRA